MSKTVSFPELKRLRCQIEQAKDLRRRAQLELDVAQQWLDECYRRLAAAKKGES